MMTDTMSPGNQHGLTKNRRAGTTQTLESNLLDSTPYEDLDFTGVDFLTDTSSNISYTRPSLRGDGSDTLQAKSPDLLLSWPQPKAMYERFHAIQKWEGYVIDADDEVFRARLIPLKGEGSEQEAEIYLSEITEEDRCMVQPGAVFYWSIGYLDKPSGTMRASIIRFRRLPKWTAQEIAAAENKVAELKELLGV